MRNETTYPIVIYPCEEGGLVAEVPALMETRFMHLHLGIDATDLPTDLACHYIAVEDWERGVDAPQRTAVLR